MSAAELFDPIAGPRDGWPTAKEVERAYLEAFARSSSTAFISNLRTQVLGMRWRDHVFPVTVNRAEYGDAYVCLPHTAYALYAKAELKIVNAGPWTPALGLLADAAGYVLRRAKANRIVHLNNWMLSTNLLGDWSGEGIEEMRDLLIRTFPDHFIAVRSINTWSDAELAARFRRDGWHILPSRQIYVTDDLDRDWFPRKNTRRDLKLLAKMAFEVDMLETLRPGDADEIARLYGLLYLERYSKLNPVFTPAYIEMTHRERIFRYRGIRDGNGQLIAVVGCFVRGGILTTPIVGYDTRRPVKEGLYRMASVLFAQMAREAGARLNGSAGAADFKRLRGARPVIEYSAVFADHLPRARRAVIEAQAWLLNKVAVPLLVERGL